MLDVLLVEDETDVRECIASWLEEAGHRVTQASDGGCAATLLASHAFDLAICDVHLPTLDGLSLARRARHLAPSTAVVMMSSQGSVADVVSSLRDGAIDYVVKPFEAAHLVERIVGPIAQRCALRKQFEAARAEWGSQPPPAVEGEARPRVRVVSESVRMRALVERLKVFAVSESAVLLHGERGSGKKTLARLLHDESPRRLGPFVVVPCDKLAELIIESELRALGSDDDRDADRDAWFRQAEGGTLVLDGVDRIPPHAQATLARVLAEPGSVARHGSRQAANDQPRGVRVVATAETDLSSRVFAGKFLEPLFYRLSAAVAEVPPLRDRVDDLLPLVAALLAGLAGRTFTPSFEPSAYQAVLAYSFPGNVSELAWALKYAFLMADSAPIDAAHLPHRITAARPSASAGGLPM